MGRRKRTWAEDIHLDWAGPWPLHETGFPGARHGAEDGPIWMWLFLDHWGEIFEPNTFFVAFRRYIKREDDEGLIFKRRVGRGWENGEILQADGEIVLLLTVDECEMFAQALEALAVAAPHDFDRDRVDRRQVHWAGLSVWQLKMKGRGVGLVSVESEACTDQWPSAPEPEVGADVYADGTPIPPGPPAYEGGKLLQYLAVWFSDYTNDHPWYFGLLDSMQFADRLRTLITTNRRSYLDMLGERGLHVESWCYWDPSQGDEPSTGLDHQPIDWDDLEGQAWRTAERYMMGVGCNRVRVSLGGMTLAEMTVDDLTDEQRAAWEEHTDMSGEV